MAIGDFNGDGRADYTDYMIFTTQVDRKGGGGGGGGGGSGCGTNIVVYVILFLVLCYILGSCGA